MPTIRALGPGSVSSLLKVILDVAYVLLWIVGGIFGIFIFILLLISFDAQNLPPRLLREVYAHGTGSIASAILMLSDGVFNVAGMLVVIQRLRKIFATMIMGDPFDPQNVRRLRVVGLFLALLEIGRYLFAAIHHFGLHEPVPQVDSFSLTGWFAVLVVFVLAEVFREGSRLRRDAELTI